jgi:hypothetical protein
MAAPTPPAATHDVYLGLALAAVATLAGVLVIVGRRFAASAGATASSGPAGTTGRRHPPPRPGKIQLTDGQGTC